MIASVQLENRHGLSPEREEVRGYDIIEWAPNHVVFHMKDGTTLAYRADRVIELVTYVEETDENV